mmetsp:Transcript_22344/g.51800  ORF Transcript_22344/g.51800 Transcript_22344/m.51800 type:complete len:569 (+) Transcript_22344:28-1734(+)
MSIRISVQVVQLFLAVAVGTASPKPHIIHILADDLGWADVGYHRAAADRDVQTPNIDAFARSGIELDRFYTYQFCSPARSAIQTGRNPIHVNAQNVNPECVNSLDTQGGFQGIPVNMTGIASHLKNAGYRTHIVGKWDVGMATPQHHPRARGYESWLGYWHHDNDYWQHTVDSCGLLGLHKMRDLWIYNATYDGPAWELANGPKCSQTHQNPENETCVYEEALLMSAVKSVIRAHNPAEPLFLFWSMHLVHMPLQVPLLYEQKFAFIKNSHRRMLHAMVNYMDDELGDVINLLKEREMWNNSVVVWHSDNGGEIMGAGICGGNNWPLRGGKFSNFEGGIRVNALVSGGLVPEVRRGSRLEGFATAWDWYATYAALAGVDPFDHRAAAAGLPQHDSLNLWPWLAGAADSPRKEVIVGETSALTPNSDGETFVGGIISGRYKLLVGVDARKWNSLGLRQQVSQNVMTGPSWPNSSSHLVPLLHPRLCSRDPEHGCLFDIFNDPSETTSLAAERTDIFHSMLARVDELQRGVYSPKRGSEDSAACRKARQQYRGYWGPWIDTEPQAALVLV